VKKRVKVVSALLLLSVAGCGVATEGKQNQNQSSNIAINIVNGIKESVDEVIKPSHKLYISVTPENAKIKLVNLDNQTFYQGIELEEDRVLIEATKKGYQKYFKWHDLEKETTVEIVMEKNRSGVEKLLDGATDKAVDLFKSFSKDDDD
jgi:thymidylate kinase